MAGDAMKVVSLCYATVTEQLRFREFTAIVVGLASCLRGATKVLARTLTLGHIK